MSTATLELPPGIPSDGTVKVAVVPDEGFDDLEAPAATEVEAGTDISCHLMQDGYGESADEGTNTDRRLCSKEAYTIGGSVTWTITDLRYVYDPQNPSSLTHKAYAALAPGTFVYLVARWGKDATDPWAEGDVVDIYRVQLGVQRKQTPEANSELKVLQTPFVQDTKVTDVALT